MGTCLRLVWGGLGIEPVGVVGRWAVIETLLVSVCLVVKRGKFVNGGLVLQGGLFASWGLYEAVLFMNPCSY